MKKPKAALLLDLENLVADHRFRRDFTAIRLLSAQLVRQVKQESDLVFGLASCDPSLAREVNLAPFGIRTVEHAGGRNAADLTLIAMSKLIPDKAKKVYIASGDGGFAELARSLSAKGKDVEFIGRRATTSRRIVDAFPTRYVTGRALVPATA